MKNFAWLVFALLLSLPISFAAEKEGPISSGGGSGQPAEFYRIARGISYALFHKKQEISPSFPVKRLAEIVRKLQVEATREQLDKDGIPVEALNFPSLVKVKFNGAAWDKKQPIEKIRLAAHEILGLLGLPDPQYRQSDFIAEQVYRHLGDVSLYTHPLVDNTDENEQPVVCKAIEGYYPNVVAEFLLQPGAGGAQGWMEFKGYYAEVYISYGIERQVRLDIRKKRERGDGLPAEHIGKIHATTMMNYVGDFKDAEVWGERFALMCKPMQKSKN